MSVQPASFATRTLPPRPPDGFWLHQRRYFWYVLFAGTGFALSLACIVLLFGLGALGKGFDAWATYLAVLRSPPVLLVSLALWVAILYFSIRFLWVGVKVATFGIGPIPAPPRELIIALHYAGLVTLTLALLVVLSGIVV